ncbi:glutaminase kidney isoform, mitochondrial-like [Ruditapes philippinarum]|uniref:glutaminase kidney isoform, mitochondrial-like n=1 Tax=Ruditapes philippinarum TaxID=129788 RepID=UPI00295B7F2F|nr:glutaminase kidney isoform, mitochondrial-like [Ruditapes philippinarum]
MSDSPRNLKRRMSSLKQWQEGLEELLSSGMEDFEEKLFTFLCDQNELVSMDRFKNLLEETGLRDNDFRLNETMKKFRAVLERQLHDEHELRGMMDKDTFLDCVSDNIVVISKALTSQFVIPEFRTFTDIIDKIFKKCEGNEKGTPAQYIPQLARGNPKHWGVSICTVDGQRFVNKFVGKEPSGRSFNELTLDYQKSPNPNELTRCHRVDPPHLKKGLVLSPDRFDIKVGLPSKSGVAGGVLLVIPNLMGIFTWSPPLDQWG